MITTQYAAPALEDEYAQAARLARPARLSRQCFSRALDDSTARPVFGVSGAVLPEPGDYLAVFEPDDSSIESITPAERPNQTGSLEEELEAVRARLVEAEKINGRLQEELKTATVCGWL